MDLKTDQTRRRNHFSKHDGTQSLRPVFQRTFFCVRESACEETQKSKKRKIYQGIFSYISKSYELKTKYDFLYRPPHKGTSVSSVQVFTQLC